MYLGCADPDAELLRRSRLFAGLDTAEQARLLLLVLLNDLRGSGATPERRQHLLAELNAAAASSRLDGVVGTIESLVSLPHGLVGEVSRELSNGLSRRPSRWAADIAVGISGFTDSVADTWELSAVLAVGLVRAGHVPCPAFAFGAWHLAPGDRVDEERVRHLVELACCYAYRLVGLRQVDHHPDVLVGRGAYSMSTRDGSILTKTGINLAATDFMLEQEARLLQHASRLPMIDRLPQLHGWNPRTAALVREYIPGPTGHQLLLSGQFGERPSYADDLRQAHHLLADGLRELGVSLDLHPGNFVWHTRRQRWVLVDAGPVPAIGSEYYDLDSFEHYLEAVWLRRLDNMRREPVRSLDWEPLLP